MKKYSQQLQSFLANQPRDESYQLTALERKLFRSLKAMGERATKGREVSECEFDVQHKGDRTTLRMILEGRHSMSVGHHVARRFEEHDELEFVDVVKTKKGAKVVLRPKEKHDA